MRHCGLTKLSQNAFFALYRSFTECVFVEEDGEIVFYKNARGEAARQLASDVLEKEQDADRNAAA